VLVCPDLRSPMRASFLRPRNADDMDCPRPFSVVSVERKLLSKGRVVTQRSS
jgi:hypothetical protein